MKGKDIILRQEIYKSDALKILNWVEDREVSRYLNERSGVGNSIKEVVSRVNMPILTPLFNQNSSFFIILNNDEPIGFLRLVPKGNTAEMVVAIGEKEKWGMGLGPNAILEGLKKAFFNWKVDEVVAKINFKNHRSKRAFTKAGFEADRKLLTETQYSITLKNFLKLVA